MKHALNVYQLLELSTSKRPDVEALVDGQHALNYAQLFEAVDLVAHDLASHGVCRGTRVVISMSKSISETVTMLAASRLRATMVNVSTVWTHHELARICDATCASVLCIDEARRYQTPFLSRMCGVWLLDFQHDEDGHTQRAWSLNGATENGGSTTSIHDFLEEVGSPMDRDIAAIVYTSGSTGKPKGVVHSNASLLASIRSTVEFLGNRPDDRVLCALPFCFNYGLGQLLSMLCVGGTAVLQRPGTARELVEAIINHEITGFGTIPPVWTEIVDHLASAAVPAFQLRYITTAGGKCSARLLAALQQHFAVQRKYVMYGTTEAIRSTYLAPELFLERSGSIGRAVPNTEVHVVAADGTLCGPNEPGELVHCGASVALGYWGDAEETAAKFSPYPVTQACLASEKAYFTGDIVRRDEDGFLWYVGRADRMLKSSGFRISPSEIEDALGAIEGVEDAIAFGEHDEECGERIHAVVRIAHQAALTDQDLRRFCRDLLPGYMVPSSFHFWAGEFPRTGNSKIDIPAVIALVRKAMER